MQNIDRSRELSRLLEHERSTRKAILSIFATEALAIARWQTDLPIALVLGGPRGGTSAFKGALSKHPDFLALSGEHRLFFTLLGMNFPDGTASCECDNRVLSNSEREELLEMLFVSAFGGPEVSNPSDREALRYAWDWAYRIPMQWTGIRFENHRVVELVLAAVAEYKRLGARDLAQLDTLVLKSLSKAYPEIDVAFYDGQEIGSRKITQMEISKLPIYPIVEITPFVVPRPRSLKSLSLRARYLLLKASSDPFRLNTIRSLFQNHTVHILRLSRNPLASINGLIDGWQHHCFWQHDLDLNVANNSLAGWCFDLVHNWKEILGAQDLLTIARRQWLEPNTRIEVAANAPKPNERWLRYKFEDFILSTDARHRLLECVLKDLNVPPHAEFDRVATDPPKINVTVPTTSARWKLRNNILSDLIADPEISELAEALGYETEHINEWI